MMQAPYSRHRTRRSQPAELVSMLSSISLREARSPPKARALVRPRVEAGRREGKPQSQHQQVGAEWSCQGKRRRHGTQAARMSCLQEVRAQRHQEEEGPSRSRQRVGVAQGPHRKTVGARARAQEVPREAVVPLVAAAGALERAWLRAVVPQRAGRSSGPQGLRAAERTWAP